MAVYENPPVPVYKNTVPHGKSSKSEFGLSAAASMGALTDDERGEFTQLLLHDRRVAGITTGWLGETNVTITHRPTMKTSDIKKLAAKVVKDNWKVMRDTHER